jgi:cytochrome P450
MIPAVFWCLLYVLRDTKAVETIRQEIDTYLPIFSLDNDTDDAFIEEWTSEHLNAYVYLESAVNETLPLAVAPLITRKCSRETQLVLHDGRTIDVKPNETVAWFAGITHRDVNIFSDPNEFVFDRFVDKNTETIP